MSKKNPIRLTLGPDKVLNWPLPEIVEGPLPEFDKGPLLKLGEDLLPELDENRTHHYTLNTLGDDDFVRSIEGMAVVFALNGDVLVYGQRTMTVNHLPDNTYKYRGRVSLEGKGCKGVTARLQVRMPDGLMAVLKVLKVD